VASKIVQSNVLTSVPSKLKINMVKIALLLHSLTLTSNFDEITSFALAKKDL
jgi:hypothetical protein